MILFVGDKPSSIMVPNAKPFEGSLCEHRLKEWIKSLVPAYREYKILNSNTASSIENILFNYNRFRGPECEKLHFMIPKIVALGNNASKVLSICHIQHFKLPHPSGRNRQINNKKFIEQKLKECKEWLKCHT